MQSSSTKIATRWRAMVALVFIGVAPGCYGSHAVSGGDRPEPDAGRAMDAGASPTVDAGLASDGGADGEDGGHDASSCGPAPVPPYTGPICSDATRECTSRCEGDTSCEDGCLGADPDCLHCIGATVVGCANDRGCQRGWDQFACCVARASDECRAGFAVYDLLPCHEECLADAEPFDRCYQPVAGECTRAATERCRPFE